MIDKRADCSSSERAHGDTLAPRRLLRTTDWAFIVVSAAAYLSLFLQADARPAPARLALLVGLGLIYTAVGTLGFEAYILSASTRIKVLYFVFQLSLSASILILGQLSGALWLLWLPLVSHSAVLFERSGVILVSGTVMALFGVLVGMAHGWQAGLSAGLAFGPGIIFVLIFTQMALNESRARTEVERLARDLRDAHTELARYAVQAEELATEKERNRLAREIHDSLGHYLTAINMQLEAARAVQVDDAAQVAALLERAQALTKEGLQEVRQSVAALRASPLEGKSLASLLEALAQACIASGIETAFEVAGTPRPLSPQVELALYRSAQEALTNVRKHAQARHAEVILSYEPDRVCLRVQDDGVGNVPSAVGFGLVGLRERVQLLGGELHVEPKEGRGFVLEAIIADWESA